MSGWSSIQARLMRAARSFPAEAASPVGPCVMHDIFQKWKLSTNRVSKKIGGESPWHLLMGASQRRVNTFGDVVKRYFGAMTFTLLVQRLHGYRIHTYDV